MVVADDWTVTYARGADIGVLAPDPDATALPEGEPMPTVFHPSPADHSMIAEAVTAARDADAVVAVVGDVPALTGEWCSTATLGLQGGQVALLDALSAAGTPIVVLVNSKPAVLPDSALNAAAVIQAFNLGMRGGRAIAELVLGLIEPTGRLPVSFARHVGQQPVYYNQIRGQHGYLYADLTQDPMFAFGEGLSYSRVEYRDLTLRHDAVTLDGTLHAKVAVTNTGTRPALETVQAYVRDLVTSVTWAERELKAYRQVLVAPGDTATVVLEIPAAACSIVTADAERVVEPGEFELLVGPSSRTSQLLRAGFTITALSGS